MGFCNGGYSGGLCWESQAGEEAAVDLACGVSARMTGLILSNGPAQRPPVKT